MRAAFDLSTLRAADEGDLPAVAALLSRADLPLEGVEETTLFVLEQDGRVIGVVGYERYGLHALLRSLTVAEEARGEGHGRRLMQFILEETRRTGCTAVYGLTTTISDWLLELGFSELTREELPEATHASAELQGACPASARVFGLELTSP
jgi:amino-acid N-acetyltransferase